MLSFILHTVSVNHSCPEPWLNDEWGMGITRKIGLSLNVKTALLLCSSSTKRSVMKQVRMWSKDAINGNIILSWLVLVLWHGSWIFPIITFPFRWWWQVKTYYHYHAACLLDQEQDLRWILDGHVMKVLRMLDIYCTKTADRRGIHSAAFQNFAQCARACPLSFF